MTRLISQLGPLAAALVAKVEADTVISALLATPGIYNTSVPINANFPYLVIAFSQESADNVFGAPGLATAQTIDIWTKRISITGGGAVAHLGNDELVSIYSALYGLLHNQPMTVTGFRDVVGTVSLLATMVDPDGETLHAIVRYDRTSRQA